LHERCDAEADLELSIGTVFNTDLQDTGNQLSRLAVKFNPTQASKAAMRRGRVVSTISAADGEIAGSYGFGTGPSNAHFCKVSAAVRAAAFDQGTLTLAPVEGATGCESLALLQKRIDQSLFEYNHGRSE